MEQKSSDVVSPSICIYATGTCVAATVKAGCSTLSKAGALTCRMQLTDALHTADGSIQ